MLAEYVARRFVRYLFPQVSSPLVDEMAAMALAYASLVALIAVKIATPSTARDRPDFSIFDGCRRPETSSVSTAALLP